MAIPISFYTNLVWVVTLYSGGSITPGLLMFIIIHVASFAIGGVLPYTILQFWVVVPLVAVLYIFVARMSVSVIFGWLPWMFD
jgi:hypothetical protein